MTVVWRVPLTGPGLGGIAATRRLVIFGDRDPADEQDVFRCLESETGKQRWTLAYPAAGQLDYGNSPRATPLIHQGRVFLQGAIGHLHCVSARDGVVLWSKNLQTDFGPTEELTWGTCGSPVLADGRLIVAPGAPNASVVALDPATGEVIWQTPGAPTAYGSLLAGEFGGVRQVIGHDQKSLGGWDVRNGKRLWELRPVVADDFNVPTPVAIGGRLLISSENNGTRLHAFTEDGRLIAKPLAADLDVAPDTSTPVVVGNHVYVLFGSLYCFSIDDGKKKLKRLWSADDPSFATYASLIGGNDRLLMIGASGDVLLLDATADQFRVISRMKVFDDGDAELYAHPALVGDRLYIRGEAEIVCVRIAAGE